MRFVLAKANLKSKEMRSVRKTRVILFVSLIFVIAFTLVAGSFVVSPMPALAHDGNPHLVKTFPGPDGKDIDEVVFPSKPPVDKIKQSIDLPPTGTGVNYISSDLVPAFDWSYGCSATSASMLFGYYDRNNYPNMYTGIKNGGVCPLPTVADNVWGYTSYPEAGLVYECPLSATHQGIEDRPVKGHVDDYWIDYNNNSRDPYIADKWQQHASDSVGDFMGTNQSAWHNSDGSTTFYFSPTGDPLVDFTGKESQGYRDGAHGMKLFAESRGYTVTTTFNQYIQGQGSDPTKGFTFANYKSEIDAGRPVLIQVEGHTMLGFGYNTTDSVIYLHDTWDFSDHQMTWGGSYLYSPTQSLQHYGVTVFQLTPVNPALTVTINQAAGQADPTNGSPINFTVVFSENVTDFSAADVTLSSGTAVLTGSATTYNVAVSGMAQGVLSASLAAGVAHNATGNPNNASISTDNAVTYYVPPPTVAGLSSSSGPTAGGTSVTISGDNFTGATQVKFGSDNATSFTFDNDTQITATSPAGTGTVDVTVTTTGGTSAASSADQFTYTVDVDINVTLQGGGRPDAGWVVPLTVKFFDNSTGVPGTILYTFTENTTKSGSTAIVQTSGILPGTYDISAVTSHCLTNVKNGVVITAPLTAIDLGTLLEGNADDNDIINITDFGVLAASYGKSSGDSGYDARADFDRNGIINIADFGLLAANYGKIAPVEVP